MLDAAPLEYRPGGRIPPFQLDRTGADVLTQHHRHRLGTDQGLAILGPGRLGNVAQQTTPADPGPAHQLRPACVARSRAPQLVDSALPRRSSPARSGTGRCRDATGPVDRPIPTTRASASRRCR